MFKHLLFLIVFIQSVFLFGQSDQDKQLEEVYTLFFGGQLEEAKSYIHENFLKSTSKSRQVIGYVYLAQYYEYTEKANNKKHLEAIEKAKKIARQTNNEIDQAYVDFGYTMYYKSIGQLDLYINSLWKSLNAFKKYPNENFNLAKLYASKYKSLQQNPLEKPKIDDYNKTLHYAQLSKNKILISTTYNDIATFYYHIKNDLKTAETYFNKSFNSAKEVKDYNAKKALLFYHYINMGGFYTSNQEYNKALNLFNQGLKMTSDKDFYYLCSLNNNIGYTYALMGKNETALEYYKISDTYSKHRQISNVQRITIATNIFEAYEKLNQLDQAIEYLKKVKDDIVVESQRRYDYNTQSLEAFYKTKEQNNLLTEKNKTYEEQKNYLFGIIVLSISSILMLIFMLNYRKKLTKQRTNFLEAEKEKLQIEKELSELKQEHFQKQVLATSIQLEQKNNFLEELKNNIKNNKDFNLNRYLKNEQLIDKDLNNIHNIVKEVHPNFFKNLNDIATSRLTNLDIKYAAYIYMNMDNSQIASILNVDPKTVSVTKYRLKQKLGITKEIDLDTFIRNLNQ
ncbi:LuxR C-terminal-related transcriptional regulator [Empedobacter brevis]|uniref:LuxR C-terminal-related transcriptional regulator n=1 Tax=Empedobacter brevis TaxID=247 RepID=UPI002FE18185